MLKSILILFGGKPKTLHLARVGDNLEVRHKSERGPLMWKMPYSDWLKFETDAERKTFFKFVIDYYYDIR